MSKDFELFFEDWMNKINVLKGKEKQAIEKKEKIDSLNKKLEEISLALSNSKKKIKLLQVKSLEENTVVLSEQLSTIAKERQSVLKEFTTTKKKVEEEQVALASITKEILTVSETIEKIAIKLNNRKEELVASLEQITKERGKKRLVPSYRKEDKKSISISSDFYAKYTSLLGELKQVEQLLSFYEENYAIEHNIPSVSIDWKYIETLSLEERMTYFDDLGTLIINEAKQNPKKPVKLQIGSTICTVNKRDKEVFKTSLTEFKKAKEQLDEEKKPSVSIDWEYVKALSLEERMTYFDDLGTSIINESKQNPKKPVKLQIGSTICTINERDAEVFKTSLAEYKKAKELLAEKRKKEETKNSKSLENVALETIKVKIAEELEVPEDDLSYFFLHQKENPFTKVVSKIKTIAFASSIAYIRAKVQPTFDRISVIARKGFSTCLSKFEKAQKIFIAKVKKLQKPSVSIDWKYVSRLSLEEKIAYFDDLGTSIINNAKTNPKNPISLQIGSTICTINKRDAEVFKTSLAEYKKAKELLEENKKKEEDKKRSKSLENVTLETTKVGITEKLITPESDLSYFFLHQKENPFTNALSRIKKISFANSIEYIRAKVQPTFDRISVIAKKGFSTCLSKFEKAQKIFAAQIKKYKKPSVTIDWEHVNTLSSEEKADYFLDLLSKIVKEAELHPSEVIEVTIGKLTQKINAIDEEIFTICYREYEAAKEEYLKPQPSFTIDWEKAEKMPLKERINYFGNLILMFINAPKIDAKPIPVGKFTVMINAFDEEDFNECCEEYISAKEAERKLTEKNQVYVGIDWKQINKLSLEERISYFEYILQNIITKPITGERATVYYGNKIVSINALDKKQYNDNYNALKTTKLMMNAEKTFIERKPYFDNAFAHQTEEQIEVEEPKETLHSKIIAIKKACYIQALDAICDKPVKHGVQYISEIGIYRFDRKYKKIFEKIMDAYLELDNVTPKENDELFKVNKKIAVATAAVAAVAILATSTLSKSNVTNTAESKPVLENTVEMENTTTSSRNSTVTEINNINDLEILFADVMIPENQKEENATILDAISTDFVPEIQEKQEESGVTIVEEMIPDLVEGEIDLASAKDDIKEGKSNAEGDIEEPPKEPKLTKPVDEIVTIETELGIANGDVQLASMDIASSEETSKTNEEEPEEPETKEIVNENLDEEEIIEETQAEAEVSEEPIASVEETQLEEETINVGQEILSDVEIVPYDVNEIVAGYHLTMENTTYTVSEEEFLQVAYVVQQESLDGSYEDALGVTSVILNRMEDGRYSYADSLLAVVSAPGQFTVWDASKAAAFTRAEIQPEVLRAMNDALYNGIRNNDYVEFKSAGTAKYSITGEFKIQFVANGNKYHHLAKNVDRCAGKALLLAKK